ncbi:DUF6086 family protein [Amycolatopsis sp. NPDC059090]|uniref:DUF6086 family protein n=1 Tax=unclassified Amycolatopsis TaxID=2618356 RepID=UPI00366C5582
MSYIFTTVDDEDVWSPALRVGRLFANMGVTLAHNFDLDISDAGLSPMAADFYYVDPAKLAVFVRTVLDSSVMTHQVYRELARGFLGVCLVLLERSGIPVEDVPPDVARCRDSMRNIPS